MLGKQCPVNRLHLVVINLTGCIVHEPLNVKGRITEGGDIFTRYAQCLQVIRQVESANQRGKLLHQSVGFFFV